MREKRTSKENKASIISIGLYHFHNLLVKGTFARIVAFSIVALVICLVLGFVLSFVPGSDGSVLTSLWNTTLCMLDGGTIAGMEASSEQTGALFIVTLFGVVFTSVLVGIITLLPASKSAWKRLPTRGARFSRVALTCWFLAVRQ